LCWIYDSNRVTIEGHTDIAFTEDVAARFLAYGWNVGRVMNPNDLGLLERSYRAFLNGKDRPTLIIVHSHIGYGAPHRQDTPSAHDEPLGADEVRLTKEFFGFDPAQTFVVPEGVRAHFNANIGTRGAELRKAWNAAFARYRAQYPDLSDQIECLQKRDLPDGWDAGLPTFAPSVTGMSTRDAASKILNAVAERVPWLVGGAADLAPSTKTRLAFEFAGDFQAGGPLGDHRGRNFHFGVREHAMCAAVNGMTLSGLRAFASGFLIFTDYARGAIRLASLMDLPVLHIWTHDSISVGEDGPTHQPIEQIVSLRAIPGMIVIRPADANEMTEAYRFILRLKNRPAALICSRQAMPIIDRGKFAPASELVRGGYILADTPGSVPDVILIGTGSEVSLCLAARERLAIENIGARVVSMPSWELFEDQDLAYRQSVLPPAVTARVTVEEASPIGWDRYAGPYGVVLGMRSFGMSAPMKIVAEHFGFKAEHVAAAAKSTISRAAGGTS
jgi:transketolase